MPLPELPFSGLGAKKRFLSVNERAAMSFYPLPRFSAPITGALSILGGLTGALGLSTEPPRGERAIRVDWGKQTDGLLTGLSFSKVLGQASGRWQAMFKAGGIDWANRQVWDGDWADLILTRNGVDVPICRGFVDSVREGTRSVGGATVRTWTVSGRDHGAIFEYPMSWTSIWVQTLGEVVAGLMTKEVQGKIGGRPDELFSILIKAGIGPGKLDGQWELPPSLQDQVGTARRAFDLLRVVPLAASKAAPQDGLRGAYWNEPRLWNEGGQNLHQVLMSWCNPLLNEVFYDLVPAPEFMPPHGLQPFLIPTFPEEAKKIDPKDLRYQIATQQKFSLLPTLTAPEFGTIGAYIRERPFPSTVEGLNSLWFALPTWLIPDWIIESTDLGWSGAERYNLFELTAELGLGAANEHPVQCRPFWFRDGIRHWGLRSFQQTTPFCARDGDFGKWIPERDTWQRLLIDWYGPSPWLRQGSITFRVALPEIRVGQRLVIASEDREEQFYVEGVRHDWSFPPGRGSTTVTVTHGFAGTDNLYLQLVKKVSELYEKVVDK